MLQHKSLGQCQSLNLFPHCWWNQLTWLHGRSWILGELAVHQPGPLKSTAQSDECIIERVRSFCKNIDILALELIHMEALELPWSRLI